MKYSIDRSGSVVGFSVWPWDNIYSPLVGCYRSGRLVAWAECNQLPQQGLEGPAERYWFRMEVSSEVRILLERNDPSVQLKRCEDGAPLVNAGGSSAEEPSRHRVEDFLAYGSLNPSIPLWGFTAYLAAPPAHRAQILFLDILGRMPDPEAERAYTEAIERGASTFDLREEMLRSEEFRGRGITVSDRVGALMTSPIWNHLRTMEPLGERRRPLRQLRMSDYANMTSEQFATAIHIECHGDAPSEGSQREIVRNVELQGRAYVAALLLRDASQGGSPMELIDA